MRSPSVPSSAESQASASQFGQDVYLDRFVFCGRRNGTFLDLGGFDGVVGSNTLLFERDRGWSGVLVEPDPDLHARAAASRTCPCVRAAITSTDGRASFWRPTKADRRMMGGLAESLRPDYLAHMRSEFGHVEETIDVETVSPRSLLERFGIEQVDLVSLDIEGAERAVLEAFPFDDVPVGAWTIENLEGSTDIKQFMVQHGYELVRRLGVDEIYVLAADAAGVVARADVDRFGEAVELLSAGFHAHAVAANRALLERDPEDPDVWNNLGLSLAGMLHEQESLDAHLRAFRLDPDRASHRRNVQRALLRLDLADEAHELGRAVTCPTAADAALTEHAAFEVAYRNGATDDAVAASKRWQDSTDSPQPELALAEALLAAGRLNEGWMHYEARRDTNAEFHHQLRALAPWHGGPLDGVRLLVVGEQGLGDHVFFSRFLPIVAERGAAVTVAAHRPLERLLSGLGVAVVAPDDRVDLSQFDCWARVGSLPLLTGTSTIVEPSRFDLPVDSTIRARSLVAEQTGSGPSLRGGLAWAGVADTHQQRLRHVPLDDLRPLIDLPHVRWFSLMKGPAVADVATCGLDGRIVDASSSDRDLADTAALCAALDFVVTVCTVTAHVAASMGVPTYVLLHDRPFWVWGHHERTSPWYPAARLVRQQQPGEWAPVVRELVGALEARADGGES